MSGVREARLCEEHSCEHTHTYSSEKKGQMSECLVAARLGRPSERKRLHEADGFSGKVLLLLYIF